MRFLTVVPIGLLAAGIALVAVSVANGEAEVSLVVIFPVFSGSSASFLLGMLLVIAGLLSGFLTFWATASGMPVAREDEGERRIEAGDNEGGRRFGGLVLIGPIPIAFGSSSKIAYTMLGVGVAVVLIILALVLLSFL